MFLFIIAKIQTENINTISPIHALEPFGFEIGGKYKVQFSIQHGKDIFYSLVSKVDSKKVNNQNLPLYCSNKESIPGIVYSLQNLSLIQGNITKKQVVHPMIINCDSISSDETPRIKLEVKSLFSNPNTHFDYRWSNYQIEKLIVILIAFALFISWIINWVTHFSVQIWFHYFLSVSFLLILTSLILRFFYIHQMDVKDDYSSMSSTFFSSLFITLTFVFSTLLFAAKGWGIVRDSLSLSTIFFSILFSCILCGNGILLQLVQSPSWLFITIFVLCLVLSMTYIYFLMKSVNDITMLIMAHMLVISNSGIDPTTTPVYQKYKMYYLFQYGVCLGCIIIVSILIIQVFWYDYSYIVMEGIIDFSILIVSAFFGIIFRLRGSKIVQGYNLVEEESEMLNLQDLKGLSLNSPELHKGNQAWTENTPLPPEPSLITLETPDGTKSINGMLSDTKKEENEANLL